MPMALSTKIAEATLDGGGGGELDPNDPTPLMDRAGPCEKPLGGGAVAARATVAATARAAMRRDGGPVDRNGCIACIDVFWIAILPEGDISFSLFSGRAHSYGE